MVAKAMLWQVFDRELTKKFKFYTNELIFFLLTVENKKNCQKNTLKLGLYFILSTF